MKIETTIKPRRDGTVTAQAPSGAKYVFKAEDGRLVADVENEADLAFLLDRDEFLPADEADFEAAANLVKPDGKPDDDSGVDDGSQVGEVEDLDDDEPADENAAPVEVATPPKPGRGAKKAK